MFGDWREPTSERLTGRRGVSDRARFLRLHPTCLHCEIKGRVRIAEEIDHIVPLCDGGFDIDSNKQALCKPCHKAKTSLDFGHKTRRVIGADGWPVEVRAELSIEASERRMPTDLQPSRIPLVIVCGPPGSGKSTYVREHAWRADIVIDLDEILMELSGSPEHEAPVRWLPTALNERNQRLRSLHTDSDHERAWFIVSAPHAQERATWQRMLGGELVLLDVPLAECVRRINATGGDRARKSNVERIDAAFRWWAINNAKAAA